MIGDEQRSDWRLFGGTKTRLRQDDLSSVDRPVIEKDLKLVCQESAMVVKIFLDSFSGLFQDPADDISIT